MNQNDLKEFELFMGGNTTPPIYLEQALLTEIRKRLNPRLSNTILKLFALNALGSVVTLALCPQYGLSLTDSHGLMHFFMQIHPALCFFVCGGLWMIVGQILTDFLLSFDEKRVLSRYYWGAGFSFILFSILIFACLGSLTWDLWLLLWAFGALSVVFIFGLRIRTRVGKYRTAMIG